MVTRTYIKTIAIQAPPDHVWRFINDVERWPAWTPSVSSIAKLDPGPLAIGSRVRIKQPKLLPAVWIVSEFKSGHSFAWITKSPGTRVIGNHVVEAVEAGSRVTLSVEFEGWLGRLAARMFRKLNEEYLQMEATGLKRVCEASNPTSS
jgi:carbon monoxide dehydrogenase subunit G